MYGGCHTLIMLLLILRIIVHGCTMKATDTVNLRKLSELKKINPDLKILISIGGWTWSKNFSDATLTDTSTRNFALSAVDIVSKYNLDGIDIDWEYPV
jgi:chitinase